MYSTVVTYLSVVHDVLLGGHVLEHVVAVELRQRLVQLLQLLAQQLRRHDRC